MILPHLINPPALPISGTADKPITAITQIVNPKSEIPNIIMTLPETIHTLKTFNSWRRGEEIPQPNPTIVGEAIDTAVHLLKQFNKKQKL